LSDSSESQADTESEILSKVLKKKISRREAISTIGKAAIGVGVVAVAAVGGYEYLASQTPGVGPAASSTTSSASSTTSASSSSAVVTSKTLKYLKGGSLNLLDIQTLQPSLDYHVTLGGEQLYNELQGKLTEFDDSGNIVPFMADSWSTPDGGMTWVFKLKQGVKWSDGHDFTSDDVKFNFDRLAALKSKTGFYPTLTGATVVDKYTVQVNNTKPLNFPSIAATDRAGTLMPKLADSVINPNGDDPWGKNYFSKNVVGTGPFMLSAHIYNVSDVAVKNPYYWEKDADGNQLPYLGQVTRFVQTDATTRYQQGKAGQYNAVTAVPTAFWDEVKASSDWSLQSIPSNNYAQSTSTFLTQRVPYKT